MSHKYLWVATAVFVVLAGVVLIARATWRSSSAGEISPPNANGLAVQMFALLEKDPRVRRTPTQRVVEAMASLAEGPGTDSAEARYALGLLRYYRDEDAGAAEAVFRQAIALRPQWSWPHNNLGIALFTLGREAEALESFDEAMILDPGWSRPHNDLAILYRLGERMDLALDRMQSALEMDPEGAVTQYNYGVILDYLGRHAEARAQYERVIEMDATLPAPHYNLACGYAREGDLDTALPYLKEAIRLEEHFREECEEDSDFDPIRSEAEFLALLDAPTATASPRTTPP